MTIPRTIPPHGTRRVYKTTCRSSKQLKLTDAPDTENYYYIKATQSFHKTETFEFTAELK